MMIEFSHSGACAVFQPNPTPNPRRWYQLIAVTFLALFPVIGKSQTTDFLREYQSFFQDLPTQTGRLYEATFPQMDPWRFSGGMGDDTIDAARSKELLRIAQCWDQGPAATPAQDSLIRQYLSQGIMPLWVLDLSYDRLGTDSVVLSQLRLSDTDSTLHSDRIVSQKQLLFAAVPALQNLPSRIHSVVIDDRLMIRRGYGHYPTDFVLIQNGKEAQASLRQPLAIDKSGGDDWHFALAMTLDKSDPRYDLVSNPWTFAPTQFRLLTLGVLKKAKIPLLDWRDKLKDSLLTVHQWHWDLGPEKAKVQHSAQVSIHRSKAGGTCLKRPLVLVEGIDFGYSDLWAGERDGKCGSMGYLDLLHGRLWNSELEKWEDWNAISAAPKALQQCRDSGYDIVYVDFWDGAQDMHLNAEVLALVLERLQQEYCTGPMHILGASMGGVLAKRALKLLENRGSYLCISSLTAFDSPFLGANIPLSLQAFVSYYKGILPGCSDALERQLNRPASKQLLAEHHLSNMGPHEDRALWVREDSLYGGFPHKPWLFSISSGSYQGRGGRQIRDSFGLLNPGDLMASLHTNNQWKQGIMEAVGSNAKWIKWLLIAIPEAHADLFANGQLIEGSKPLSNLVANVNFTYKKRQLVGAPRQEPSLDHLAGGFHSGMSTLSIHKLLAQVFVQSNIIQPNTCFVPLASAWSLPVIDQEQYMGKTSWNQLDRSPFHRVFAAEENQEHCFFDTLAGGNIDWFLQQLQRVDNSEPAKKADTLLFTADKQHFIASMEISAKHRALMQAQEALAAFVQRDSLSNRAPLPALRTGPCPQQVIDIKGHMDIANGCEFVVSESSTLHLFKGSRTVVEGAKLRLESESQLLVDSGAVFRVSHEAVFQADMGTRIVLQKGAIVELQGSGRMLLDGEVVLMNGADFRPLMSGNSQLHLRADSTLLQGFRIRANHPMSQLAIEGKNGELHVNGSVRVPNKKTAETWPISSALSNCRVFFHTAATLALGPVDSLVNLDCKGEQMTGQDSVSGLFLALGEPLVKNCTFQGLGKGLLSSPDLESLVLVGSRFENNHLGLEHRGGGLSLENCLFEANRNGVEVQDAWGEISVLNCLFARQAFYAFSVKNQKPNADPCFISQSRFYGNQLGVKTLYQPTILNCNTFSENQVGVEVARSWLSMSNTKKAWSVYQQKTIAGGANTFFANTRHGLLLHHTKPFLDGYNNFIKLKSCTTCAVLIGGLIDMDMGQPYWVDQSETFDLGSNYFQPTKDSLTGLVQVGYYNGVGGFTALSLACDRQSLLNGNCYPKMEWVQLRQQMLKDEGTSIEPKQCVLIKGQGLEPINEFRVIRVLNSNGALVWEGSGSSDRIDLPSGIYFVQGATDNQARAFKVFIP